MKLRITIAAVALLAVGGAWAAHARGTDRLMMGATLFRGIEQVDNFSRAARIFPSSTMAPASEPTRFPDGERIELPLSFTYGEKRFDVEEFLATTDTGALLVLKDGAIRYERYMRTGGRDVHWLSWSVSKSFVSALVGIAVAEGRIASVNDPIDRYVPALAGSGYAGVRIEDILQMSSGVSWNESYTNPLSDVNRFGAVVFLGGSLNDFVAGLESEMPTNVPFVSLTTSHSNSSASPTARSSMPLQPPGASATGSGGVLITSELYSATWGCSQSYISNTRSF